MVSGIEKSCDGEMQCRHAAGRADRADAVLQRRQPLFQNRRRRIGDARVDMSGALQIKKRGCMIRVLKHVGCRLMNRNGARARHRIGMLTRVKTQRF